VAHSTARLPEQGPCLGQGAGPSLSSHSQGNGESRGAIISNRPSELLLGERDLVEAGVGLGAEPACWTPSLDGPTPPASPRPAVLAGSACSLMAPMLWDLEEWPKQKMGKFCPSTFSGRDLFSPAPNRP
jgi:hypothetical protein